MPSAKPIEDFNARFLGAIGADGRYNRDRIFEAIGARPIDQAGHYRLTDRQRKQVQAYIERELGIKFPKGAEIDKAGNMNENEGFGKQLKKWGPIAGAAAATLFGVPGLFPGLLSGGGAAGAAGGAAASGSGGSAAGGLAPLASSTNPLVTGSILSGKAVPAAIASQGVSAAVPLASVASAAPVVTGGTLPGVTGTPVANGTFTAANTPGAANIVAPTAGKAGMDLTTGLILGGQTLMGFLGARNAANAAKDAAKMQQQSAREALDFSKGIYEDTRRMQAPWVSAGQGAIGELARLSGIPMVPQPLSAVAASPTAQVRTPPFVPERSAMPRSLATIAQPQIIGTGHAPPTMRGGSSYIQMQAPDGSIRPVAAEQAAQWEARGARRVG
jgi:hypothetical protein